MHQQISRSLPAMLAITGAVTLLGCSTQPEPEAPAAVALGADQCPRESERLEIVHVDREGEFRPLASPKAYRDPSELPSQPGARINLAAKKDVNVEWLERLAECELLAYQEGLKAADSVDPLAVEGVRAQVFQGDAGYVVELHAPDQNTAEEVYRRAVALQQQPQSSWEVGY